ncbi:Retrovirus-related Pol polyprotein from transposon TNT 1-94 [Araneus ventricosus]|uniref:Retrovirus-related Pol polyprotein from transposon TNT 1-94 n=1 Tax=Araneus ventricosus TaxID=182803 RepID=A0A4Y2SE82_ARAVE|nr:Retrovirus-related Pol polyprotein from transposon TNT 1-94 [Araneus ventricosus]
MRRNLIAGANLDIAGFKVIWKNNKMVIYDEFNDYLCTVNRKGKLYILYGVPEKCISNEYNNTSARNSIDIETVHRRFGHINVNVLNYMSNHNIVKGIEKIQGLGIKMERTSVYTPEQNGVAERFNRTAVEGIRSMLQDSGLKPQFWAEALLTFVHVKNRCVHKLTGIKTPIKIWTGYRPSVRDFRIFGSLAHVYIPSVRRNKLQPKADVGIMIGYGIKTRGYRVWVPKQRRVIETTRMSINELKNGVKHLYGTPHTYESVDVLNSSERFLNLISGNMQEFEKSGEKCKIMKEQEIKPINISSWKRVKRPRTKSSRVDIYYYPPSGKSRLRSLNDVKNYCDKENLKFEPDMFSFKPFNLDQYYDSRDEKSNDSFSESLSNDEANIFQEEIYNLELPKSFGDTRKSPGRKLWEEAMKPELKVMHDRNVWTLVDPPDK